MDDTALVNLGHATRRGVDPMDVWQIERRQVFVVKSRPLTTIWVVGLERGRRLWVLNDRVHACPDLLHEAEARIELFLHQLLSRQLTVVFFSFLEILNLAREVVVPSVNADCAPLQSPEITSSVSHKHRFHKAGVAPPMSSNRAGGEPEQGRQPDHDVSVIACPRQCRSVWMGSALPQFLCVDGLPHASFERDIRSTDSGSTRV